MDARVGANHHNVTAFAKAIDELKAQSDYEETIAFEHVKQPDCPNFRRSSQRQNFYGKVGVKLFLRRKAFYSASVKLFPAPIK